jgi:hypothetical protein
MGDGDQKERWVIGRDRPRAVDRVLERDSIEMARGRE